MRLALLTAALAALTACSNLQLADDEDGPDCFTDSCVFARCEIEEGRPCTDEDVFGPVVCNPEDPDDCDQEPRR